jgi:hypothetical protein
MKSLTLAALLALFAGDSFADSGSKTTPCYIVGKTINVDSGCTLEVKSGGLLKTDAGGALVQNGLEVPPLPDGRLSLSSTLPVPTSDITAATTLYYLPYLGQNVPIYNGTHWLLYDITSPGLNMVLSTTNMPTTQVYDVYAVNVSGTATLCSMYGGEALPAVRPPAANPARVMPRMACG